MGAGGVPSDVPLISLQLRGERTAGKGLGGCSESSATGSEAGRRAGGSAEQRRVWEGNKAPALPWRRENKPGCGSGGSAGPFPAALRARGGSGSPSLPRQRGLRGRTRRGISVTGWFVPGERLETPKPTAATSRAGLWPLPSSRGSSRGATTSKKPPAAGRSRRRAAVAKRGCS